MLKITKDNLVSLFVVLTFFAVALFFSLKDNQTKVGGNFVNSRYKCQTSTSSAIYKIDGSASSTCEIPDFNSADSADIRFMVVSSSTIPTIYYKYYVSQDLDDSSRNWFEVNNSLSSRLMSTTTIDSIGFVSIPIQNISAESLKLEYAVVGANADVYVEVIKRNEIK